MRLVGRIAGCVLGALVAVTGAAEAQSPPIWNGAYIGANLGGGFGKSSQASYNTAGALLVQSSNYNIGGVLGGITGGFNFQSNQLVFGLEADVNAANINGSLTDATCGTTTGCTSKVKGLHTARARVGFAAGSFMPYVTAGVAVANLNATLQGVTGTASATRAGFVYGLGAEMSLNRNWSIKAEYLRTNLGQMEVTSVAGLGSIKANFDGINVIRAGVNYRF